MKGVLLGVRCFRGVKVVCLLVIRVVRSVPLECLLQMGGGREGR